MTWSTIELSSIAKLTVRMEKLDPTKRYRQIGVRWWGEGAYERETITGAETQYQYLTPLIIDEIVINKIWARHGSVSVVGEELLGCYGSPEFPIYEIDKSKMFPRFFYWFTKTRMLWSQCDLQSRGTSGQNRLKPEKFLKIKIPLPPLDLQISIAKQLDDIQVALKERLSTLAEIERDTEAMLQSAFIQIIEGVEYRPLAEVAPLVRREVEIDPSGTYTEIGVRSFYKGIFHRRTLAGSEFSWQKLFRVNANDLVFSNLMAWEQAIAIAGKEDEGCFGNHRMLTCEVNTQIAAPKFLMYYFKTANGFAKIIESSPGSIARNKTLSSRRLPLIKVPVPSVEAQQRFDALCAYVDEIRVIRSATAKEAEALLPAMLHDIFERKAAAPFEASTVPNGNVVALPHAQPLSIDTPFKEAVLVGAIIKAFHEEGGQPLGNFRLQKAVYFARRFMGESALDQQYLRKAAGPYNPSMRYSGGVKIALEKNWIAPATGKFGPRHSPGSALDDANAWIEKYQLAQPAAWVRDKFKFKQNDIWEILATVDYAMLALEHAGSTPTAETVFAYIGNDEEWRPKIEKLRLSEASIQNAMVELQSMFAGLGH